MKNKTIMLLVGIAIILIVGLLSNKYLFNTTTQETPLFSSNDQRYDLQKDTRNYTKTISMTLEAKEAKIPYNKQLIDMYTYNNQVPGPIIRAKRGDTLNITLQNSLDEPTSIHWHGIKVPNEMDGVPYVTQEPVQPGKNHTYTFNLNQTGTYWYHPHYNTPEQVGKGLYGILIIDDNKQDVNYTQNNLLVLDDIRLNGNNIMPFGNPHDAMMAGRYGNNFFINGKSSFEIKTKENSLLKLNLVNTANARIFQFGIEDKKMLVLKKDINPVSKPYEVSSLILAPGERAEVLISINSTDKKNLNLYDYNSQIGNTLGKIIIEESNITNQNKYYTSLIKEDKSENIPDWANKINQAPNATFNLHHSIIDGEFRWTINGKVYPEDPESVTLEEGKFYKFRYINTQNMVHPMHLHGQEFIILEKNGVKQDLNEFKDTVLIKPGETVDIGFVAQEKGTWVNHCHILEHAEAGMLMEVHIK